MMVVHSRKNSFSVILPLREGIWPDRPENSVIIFSGVFMQPIRDGETQEKGVQMSFSTILSAAIEGLRVEFVQVEADVSNGLPVFHMVGYLSSEVKEAGERVRTAIRNSGFDYPPKRTVINLSPATLRKRGASFDLPIAVAILSSLGKIPPHRTGKCLIIGELSLDGRVRKVPGILPMAMEAVENGIACCIIPKENEAEGNLVGGMRVIGVESLQEAVTFLRGEDERCVTGYMQGAKTGYAAVQGRRETEHSDPYSAQDRDMPDFSQIKGQENVKRAAEIAVSGGHNLLMIGPPGSGKSMTAKCIAGILPQPDLRESMEITKIYSVLGLLKEESPLIRTRPFREVHHTATRAALIGGGVIPRPGEISLAHGGVLFLDELPEFKKSVLEVLRQPLEDRCIRLSRTCGNYTFPADFILVAAMNPCPCGCYPDMEKCTCTPAQIQMYLSRISHPFLDRIDLCVEAPRIKYEELTEKRTGESSADIRERVCRAREIQRERYRGTGIITNAMLGHDDLKRYCEFGTDENKLMEHAFTTMELTVRAYHRVIRTARTIADLDGEARIREVHLREALGYRMIDRKYWRR